MNKDIQLIFEAYNDMPPQCPDHLLEEGPLHQFHAWLNLDALPWLRAHKGKVIAAGGVAAALAAYMGMDPDAAQQVVDGMDPDTLSGIEGVDPTAGLGALSEVPLGNGDPSALADYLLDGDASNPIANIEQNILKVKKMPLGAVDSPEMIDIELAQGRVEALKKLKEVGHFDSNPIELQGRLRAAKMQVDAALAALK